MSDAPAVANLATKPKLPKQQRICYNRYNQVVRCKGGLGRGALIGIIIAAIVVVIILLLFAFCLHRRKKSRARKAGLVPVKSGGGKHPHPHPVQPMQSAYTAPTVGYDNGKTQSAFAQQTTTGYDNGPHTQPSYTPQAGGYTPQAGGYAPQAGGYTPQAGGYDNTYQSGYNNAGYNAGGVGQPIGTGYPAPPGAPPPPMNTGYGGYPQQSGQGV